MSEYQQTQYSNELYHYGVVGMKWGVRKAYKSYSSGKTEKGDNIASKHRNKIAKKTAYLDKDYERLNKKRNRQIATSDIKATKLANESARLRNKAYGLFVSKNRSQELLYKSNKLKAKADIIKNKSELTKATMDKNRLLKNQLMDGDAELSQMQIDKGKAYYEKLMAKKNR